MIARNARFTRLGTLAAIALVAGGLALGVVSNPGTSVAARYHLRNRTNQFYSRSSISYAQQFGSTRSARSALIPSSASTQSAASKRSPNSNASR